MELKFFDLFLNFMDKLKWRWKKEPIGLLKVEYFSVRRKFVPGLQRGKIMGKRKQLSLLPPNQCFIQKMKTVKLVFIQAKIMYAK